jgi:hypothetical protein
MRAVMPTLLPDVRAIRKWIIHRDTREPENHVLQRNRYKQQSAKAQGWVRSPNLKIELAGVKGMLAVRLAGDDSTRQEIPLD